MITTLISAPLWRIENKTETANKMKTKMKIVSLLTGICMISINLSAAEEFGSVRVEVKSKASTDYGKNESKSQERKLAITLLNTGKSAVEDLSIRWTMYGHSLKDRKLVELDSGEIKGNLEVSAKETLESKTVKLKSQRETTVSKGGRGGRGGRGRASVKKIPASGSTYYGYAVMVYDGQKLIATAFSHPSIKERESP